MSQVRDAPQARERLFFRTMAGRDVRVGRTALGDAEAPVRHVSLHIGHAPASENGARAALTPGEARQLAAALLQQAADADDVYGRTVNMASRLASVAQAGEVVVSEEVAQRADEFSYQDMGPVTLKGVTAPMRLFRAAR